MRTLGALLAVSCLASVYMIVTALRAGNIRDALLFFGFAMLLGFPAFACFRRWNTECSADGLEDHVRQPAAVRFVSHRFLVTILILTAAAILAAIIIPLVLR